MYGSIGLNRLRTIPQQECGSEGLANVVTGMAAKIANNKIRAGRF
jgi:hypothetical protein